MATNNLKKQTLGSILLQSGNGRPNHTAPIGSKYINSDNGIEYLFDNINNWATNINYENHIVVRQESDFGTISGDSIYLESNTTYDVNGVIYTSHQLVLGQYTNVLGTNTMIDRIVYLGTGSTFVSENTSNMFQDIQINAINGSVYDFTNTAKTNTMYAIGVSHLGCNNIGSFNGYYDISFTTCLFTENTSGIKAQNNRLFVMSNNLCDNFSGTMLTISGISSDNKVNLTNNLFNRESSETTPIINIVNDDMFYGGMINSNTFKSVSGTTNLGGIEIQSSPNFRISNNLGIQNETIVPHFTENEIYNFNTPPKGMITLDTDNNNINYWNGTNWYEIEGNIKGIKLFSDDFESGDFVSSGWTTVNNTTNSWVVGTAESAGGSYSAYISNNGGTTASYDGDTSAVSHIYKDIYIPTGMTSSDVLVQINFNWKCYAETPAYDYSQVFWTNTGVTPTVDTEVSSTYQIGQSYYNKATSAEVKWRTEKISIGNISGDNTYRLIFSWRDDSSVTNNPPMIIDNVKISYVP